MFDDPNTCSIEHILNQTLFGLSVYRNLHPWSPLAQRGLRLGGAQRRAGRPVVLGGGEANHPPRRWTRFLGIPGELVQLSRLGSNGSWPTHPRPVSVRWLGVGVWVWGV